MEKLKQKTIKKTKYHQANQRPITESERFKHVFSLNYALKLNELHPMNLDIPNENKPCNFRLFVPFST